MISRLKLNPFQEILSSNRQPNHKAKSVSNEGKLNLLTDQSLALQLPNWHLKQASLVLNCHVAKAI